MSNNKVLPFIVSILVFAFVFILFKEFFYWIHLETGFFSDQTIDTGFLIDAYSFVIAAWVFMLVYQMVTRTMRSWFMGVTRAGYVLLAVAALFFMSRNVVGVNFDITAIGPYVAESPIACIMNVALFIPAGFMISNRIENLALALLTGLGISLLVEAFQFLFGLGYADVLDVVANLLGVLIGALIAMVTRHISVGKDDKGPEHLNRDVSN